MLFKNIAKIAISLSLLVFIFLKTDLNNLLDAVSLVKLDLYLYSLFLAVINSFILAGKYMLVMKPSGIHQPYLRLVKINFICRFYSMFLSSALGQSVIRLHYSTKNQEGRLKFIGVMIYERASFFFVLVAAAGIAILCAPEFKGSQLAAGLYPVLIVGLMGVLLFYLYLGFPSLHDSLERFLSKRQKWNSGVTYKVIGAMGAFKMYNGKPGLMGGTLGIAVLWHMLFLLRVYILSLSLEVPAGFWQIGLIATIVLLLQALPVSLNGLGLRETAYAFFFSSQSLPPEKGVLLGLLLFSHIFIISMAGGILNLIPEK